MCTFKHWKSNPWPWHCYRHSQFLLKEWICADKQRGRCEGTHQMRVDERKRCLWREWMWWTERTEGEKNGFVSAACGVKIILQSALLMASSAVLLSIPSHFIVSPLFFFILTCMCCLLMLSKTQEQPMSLLVHCFFFWV